jgi:hypothetical protein
VSHVAPGDLVEVIEGRCDFYGSAKPGDQGVVTSGEYLVGSHGCNWDTAHDVVFSTGKTIPIAKSLLRKIKGPPEELVPEELVYET